MSSKIYILLVMLTLGAVSTSALAESVYVNDMLRVGVRDTPSSSGIPQAVVVTGMHLQVLEHSGAYIKIRTDKGVVGWIKSTYVVPDKPATLLLAGLQTEQAKLKSKLAKLQNTVDQDKVRTTAASQELMKFKQANAQLHARLRELRQTHNERDDRYLGVGIAMFLLVVGGFLAGAAWHRKQAMRRLGGLRV